MVLHYSDDLLKTPDPNGGKFGDWIVKKDTFNVTCRLCKSNVYIKEGEKALAKHSSVRQQSITRQRVPKLEPGIFFKPLYSKMLNSGSRKAVKRRRGTLN